MEKVFTPILKELRAEFLTASVTPVILSLSIVWQENGSIDFPLALLTLAGAVLLHLGTNTANDYFDHLSGNDIINTDYVRPFTGGSRMIQSKSLSPRSVLTISLTCFAAAVVVGIFLIIRIGPLIILFGMAGLISGFFYTAPPLRLAHRGLGELTVGLNFGFLIGLGTYYVQTQSISTACVLGSLPLSFLITAIIVINEFQDFNADARVGKRTLVVRAGRKRAVILYAAISLAAYIPILAGVFTGVFPTSTIGALITLPIIIIAIRIASRHHHRSKELAPANALTIASHIVTGLIFSLGFFMAG